MVLSIQTLMYFCKSNFILFFHSHSSKVFFISYQLFPYGDGYVASFSPPQLLQLASNHVLTFNLIFFGLQIRRLIFYSHIFINTMITQKLVFILALILTITYAQQVDVQSLVANNTQLLTTLNNYFGCAQWNGNTCEKCSNRYFFNNKGICCEVEPQCKLFNQDVGICQQCYEGYGLYNGTCEILTADQQVNPGCVKWDGNHNCLECSARFIPRPEGRCQAVSDYCRTWNADTGACLSCYAGYVVSENQCVVNPQPFVPSANDRCKTWNGNLCVACQDRAYFDSNGICQPVSDYCNTWDPQTGFCFTCYPGFELFKGPCQLAPTVKPSDIGCKIWDWNAQKCTSCSQNWVFNSNNVCVPVSDLCASSNSQGLCLSCYKGYDLKSGSCIVSPSNTNAPSDLGCKRWDWDNNKCLECSNRFFFGSNGICVSVSNLCNTFDSGSGACTSCFNGFTLSQGTCVTSNPIVGLDSGCSNWDWNSLTCLSCSKNWVLIANKCVAVSDQCLTWDQNTGDCLTCYLGYNLSNGKCLIQDLSLINPPDKGCNDWNWSGQICLKCSNRWYLSKDGLCTPVSDLCKTNDANGQCLSCYDGYLINNGACVANSIAEPSDLGCVKWDWNNQVCLQCSQRFVFKGLMNGKICVPTSDQCKTYDANWGNCTSCFKGYDLVDGRCVQSESNTAAPSDSGCGKWDWDNQVCLQCSKGYVFKGLMNGNKICVPTSDQCKSYDPSWGNCTSCFKGYDLVDGNCVFSSSNNAKPSDLGCAKWDWDNQVCLACSTGFVFNSNKVCVPVSDQCQIYNNVTGECLSCFHGYDLFNGQCTLSLSKSKPTDLGCKNWDWNNQICLECSANYVFNSKKECVSVSDQCKTHNNNGECTSCFKGYDLVNGACHFSDSNNAAPTDEGCSKWDWDNQVCLQCAKGYSMQALMNGKRICVIVTDLCKTYNDDSSQCTSCFKGYDLVNGLCELSQSNNAKPSDLGCGKWDWDNQVCLQCSKGFVFKGLMNGQKLCIPVSDQCKTYDANWGNCTSCFKGYDLVDGSCVFSSSNNAKPSDLGCAKWDWDNQVCLACSKGYYLNDNKICTSVSDQCKTFSNSGLCISCFKGYDLIEGNCVISSSNTAKPSDLGCANWDWDSQICLQCSKNWVFNSAGLCVPVSDLCSTWSDSGLCITCYKGYDLVKGTCVLSSSNTAKPSDLGCGNWDWNNQICISCSKGYAFNDKKVCVAVSDQCSTYNQNGQCTSCFKGYDLINGSCVFSSSNNEKPSDAGCGNWDWDNRKCISCSKGYVFNSNRVCVAVSDQCKTSDAQTGACTSCFKGYDLNNGSCTFSASNNASPSQIGCGKWDWDNQVCLQCSKRWVFNSNRQCVPVDDKCSSWDSSSGACTSCYSGYLLQNGQCALANPLCKSSDANGKCTTCYTGYVLVTGNCIPISKLASIYLYYAQCCPQKLAELQKGTSKSG